MIDLAVRTQPEEHSGQKFTALFVPGFGCRTKIFGPLAHEMNDHGFQTVVMAPHKVDEEFPEVIYEVANEVLCGNLDFDPGHLTIAGHSLGGHDTVRALSTHDDLARAVHRAILVAPAGFGGEAQWLRAVGLLTSELNPVKALLVRMGDTRRFIGDVALYSLRAGPGVLTRIQTAKHDPVIKEAKKLREQGVDMLGVLYENDHLINLKDVARGMWEAGIPYVVIDGPDKQSSDHSGFFYRPDVLVKTALEAIELYGAKPTKGGRHA